MDLKLPRDHGLQEPGAVQALSPGDSLTRALRDHLADITGDDGPVSGMQILGPNVSEKIDKHIADHLPALSARSPTPWELGQQVGIDAQGEGRVVVAEVLRQLPRTHTAPALAR